MPEFVAIDKPEGLGDLTDAVNDRLAELYDSFEANKIGIVIPGSQTNSGKSVRLTVQEVLVPLYGTTETETLIDAESILGGVKWTDLTDGGDTTLHKHDIYAALAETETITAQWLMSGSTKLTFGAATEFIHQSAAGKLTLGANTEVTTTKLLRINTGGTDNLYFGATPNAYIAVATWGGFAIHTIVDASARIDMYPGTVNTTRFTPTLTSSYVDLDMGNNDIVNALSLEVQHATLATVYFTEVAGTSAWIRAYHNYDQFAIEVGATCGRQLLLTNLLGSRDYDHVAQTNPTFFVHSATDPNSANDEWWSITHDVTDAIYNVGSGLHKFTTGNIRLAGTLAVEFNAATEYINSGAAGYVDYAAATAHRFNNEIQMGSNSITSASKLGVGTAAIPHGGVGGGIVAIEGTDANLAAGPHTQWTSSADDYPLFQLLSWSHDNIGFTFDAYYDGAWKASDASSYQIYKSADILKFAYATGTPGQVITWGISFHVQSNGNILVRDTHRVEFNAATEYIASLAAGHIDVEAATSFDVNTILELEATTSSTGQITQAGSRIFHSYGTGCLFIGKGAGNFTLTGTANIGIGENCLDALTDGVQNVGIGRYALTACTEGNYNVGLGRYALGKLTKGDYHMAIGYRAIYNMTLGNGCVGIGYDALFNATGSNNVALGYRAGRGIIGGTSNMAIGSNAIQLGAAGNFNCAIGEEACKNLTGNNTIGIGYQVLFNATSGHQMTALGTQAGYTGTVFDYCVFVGYKAGYYETGGYKLFIDVLPRTNEADGRVKALIYGIFDALTANQLVRFNARVEINEDLTLADAKNVILDTTTGTKIGTATGQKLGFWNATPVIQQGHIADPAGGGVIDAEARTAIDAINAVLAATGLTAAV